MNLCNSYRSFDLGEIAIEKGHLGESRCFYCFVEIPCRQLVQEIEPLLETISTNLARGFGVPPFPETVSQGQRRANSFCRLMGVLATSGEIWTPFE